MKAALAISFAICAAGAAAEALMTGRDSQALLRSLKQPRWSVPEPVWYVIGLGYYAACCLALYRLALRGGVLRQMAFWELIALMAANAAWNGLFFRRQDYRASFILAAVYALLAAVLVVTLSRIDRIAALGFVLYAAYLPYGLAWNWRIYRLNREESQP